MHNDGWRMRATKGGRKGGHPQTLADLKRLRKEAEAAAAQAVTAASRKEAARVDKSARGKTSTPAKTGARAAKHSGGAAAFGLDEQDKALFRRAVKSVQAIKDTQRAILPPVAAASVAILRERRQRATGEDPVRLPRESDHYSPAGIDQGDTSFVRRGYGPDLIIGLKRGKWMIDASLDLHGNTTTEAHERLDRFLQSCLEHHIRCVRIVHGKGYGSKDGEPVLRQTVRRWLSQMTDVLAYIECAEQDGGAGAVQVLLRGTQAPSP